MEPPPTLTSPRYGAHAAPEALVFILAGNAR
jgi:hypothetical protein